MAGLIRGQAEAGFLPEGFMRNTGSGMLCRFISALAASWAMKH
jgi:hypothetical protein